MEGITRKGFARQGATVTAALCRTLYETIGESDEWADAQEVIW
jgi:hypothetical protein